MMVFRWDFDYLPRAREEDAVPNWERVLELIGSYRHQPLGLALNADRRRVTLRFYLPGEERPLSEWVEMARRNQNTLDLFDALLDLEEAPYRRRPAERFRRHLLDVSRYHTDLPNA